MVRLGGESPGSGQLSAASSGAVVHRIELRTGENNVRPKSIRFKSIGELPESVEVGSVAIYEDGNRNGLLDSSDTILSEEAVFELDTDEIELILRDEFLRERSSRQWLLVYFMKQPVSLDVPFAVSVMTPGSVTVESGTSHGVRVDVIGDFPILSDEWRFIESESAYRDWLQTFFTGEDIDNPEIGGLESDPDQDGVINFIEYALGMNPSEKDDDLLPTITRDESGRFVYTYLKSETADSVSYEVRTSKDLREWFDDGRHVAETSSTLTVEGHSRIVVTLKEEAERVFVQLRIQ
jgi:hypothetical protein